MINRALIEQIVMEVLKSLKAEGMTANKPDLLIVGKRDALQPSQAMKLESAWNVIYKEAAEHDFPETAAAVIFLDATQDLLVKGALCITDTAESERLAQYMLRGVPVSLIPASSFREVILGEQHKAGNRNYVSRLLEYKETLKSFGVKVQSLSSFIESSLKAEQPSADGQSLSFKRLLTQRDVKECKEETITIGKETIVTPLARDTARDLGKSIFVMDSKGADSHANRNSHW